MDRLGTYLLLAGCAVFGAIVVAELGPGVRRDAATGEFPTQPPNVAPFPRRHSPPLDELVATLLGRPLFDPYRRPTQVAEKGPGDKHGLAEMRLTGIVTAPGQRVAIFTITGAKPRALTEGQAVGGGWQIDSITPKEVSLNGFGGTTTLQPEADGALAPEAPAPKLTFQRILPDQQTRDDE